MRLIDDGEIDVPELAGAPRHGLDASDEDLAAELPLAEPGRVDARRRVGPEARRLAPIINAYHDECDHIREAARYDVHHRDREGRGDKLVEIITAIMAREPKTMAGVLIQAEAMQALDRTDGTRRVITMMRNERWLGLSEHRFGCS